MSSKECYHFTKLNRVYGISKNGLVPRSEENSKAVNDSDSKISFSDGKMAAVCLFIDFCNVYNNMNKKEEEEGYRVPTDKKVITSKNIEDYLGEGIYLIFDGTNIENTGGNRGHINPIDAATRMPIEPEKLKVCVLKDSEGNIHYSQYEYIKYIIANLTEEDYKQLKEFDKNDTFLERIEDYKKENAKELMQYSKNAYTTELMKLEEFSKTYQNEINSDIIKYLQTHYKGTSQEISKLSKQFKNMPEGLKERLNKCQEDYKKMMEEYLNGDLSNIEIPISNFYDLYRKNLDEYMIQYCNSIINSSKEEISMLRDEVGGMEEYKDLFLHSNHHIQNVVEFAYIIGKTENTLGDDFDLLIQAAKYHDSGREESEWLTDNHADPSAEHASVELLKTGRYTPEQIAMVKVAIRYHERKEKFKNEFDEEYFTKIAKAEGVPDEKLENTRLICIYLKDADALDRVRLGNLDPDYLRTFVAKSDIFLRELGKDKDSIPLENAGLAVKRNKDFNLEQELLSALQKLKEDYSGNEIILNAIENIEKEENDNKVANGKARNIGRIVNRIRPILQIEKMVERVSANTDGIVTSPQRKEQYMKLAVERFSRADLETLELRLADVIRLSEIPRREEQENVVAASDIELIEDISVGMNDNKKVKFSDGEKMHTGYFKENIIPVFNDSSIAVSKIGELLGVKMAKIYSCEYEGKKGVISQDVSENVDKFMMMRQIIEKSKLPKIDFLNTERATATSYNPKGMVTSQKTITEMFERPLQALEKIGVSEADIQGITKDYLKMICFDYLTNQTDRNDGNYGVLIQNGKVEFAPLIDCDYILHDSKDIDNDINFTNSVRCDRNVLMSIVASKYPESVQKFLDSVNNNRQKILKIVSESFSPEMQEKYGSILDKNISELQRIANQTRSITNSEIKRAFSKDKVCRIAIQEKVARENENSSKVMDEIEKSYNQQKENQNPTLE